MTEKEIKRKDRIMKTLKRAVNSNCLKESPFTTNETITKYSAMLFNKESWENAGKLYITVDNFGIRLKPAARRLISAITTWATIQGWISGRIATDVIAFLWNQSPVMPLQGTLSHTLSENHNKTLSKNYKKTVDNHPKRC